MDKSIAIGHQCTAIGLNSIAIGQCVKHYEPPDTWFKVANVDDAYDSGNNISTVWIINDSSLNEVGLIITVRMITSSFTPRYYRWDLEKNKIYHNDPIISAIGIGAVYNKFDNQNVVRDQIVEQIKERLR